MDTVVFNINNKVYQIEAFAKRGHRISELRHEVLIRCRWAFNYTTQTVIKNRELHADFVDVVNFKMWFDKCAYPEFDLKQL